jgi:prepilin peptidase CpaA
MGLASVGLLLAMAGVGAVTLGGALAGLTLGLGLLLPMHIFGAMGAGDVKLLAAFGALLGPADVFDAFVRAAILGGVIALAVAVWRGRLRETLSGTALLVTTRSRAMATVIEHPAANNRFPYAPAIALGAALVVCGM